MPDFFLGNATFAVETHMDVNTYGVSISVEPVSNDGSGIQIGPVKREFLCPKYEPGKPKPVVQVTMIELPIYLRDLTHGHSENEGHSSPEEDHY